MIADKKSAVQASYREPLKKTFQHGGEYGIN